VKKTCGLLLTALLYVVFGATLHAQSSEAAIRQVLTDQQTAWNRGDIVAFMRGYDDSPQTTFIGKTIQRGFQMILARYQKNYATRDAMGQLTFSEVDVRMLGEDHAVATGHFHLTRSEAGGGDATGIYSLVLEKKAEGWKIVLDHTST
jgi:uncharacterized protein (TIGR02246 family)